MNLRSTVEFNLSLESLRIRCKARSGDDRDFFECSGCKCEGHCGVRDRYNELKPEEKEDEWAEFEF